MPRSYTQGATKVEVIVRKEGGGGDSDEKKQPQGAETGAAAGKGGATNKPSFKSLTGGKNRKAVDHYMAKQAFNLAKKTISFFNSTKGDRNGDKALQAQVDRQTEIAEEVCTSAFGIVMATAQWGVVGLAVSSVAVGVNLATKYAARKREYDMNIFKENQNIQYMRARAGINLTNGRLR